MPANQTILEPDGTYHIYNRANGDDLLFRSDNNYFFFLKRYRNYITPIADTFCYCLMPNHFHLVVRIRSEAVIRNVYIEQLNERSTKPSLKDIENLASFSAQGFTAQQFSNFFNSYTKAFNKYQNRNGSLFAQRFKRKPVTTEKYLRKLIHYIHYNPVQAKLADQPENWRFSSYSAMLSESKTLINRKAVIDLFEDYENFIYCHRQPPDVSGIE